eukprot:ctg_100.g106
MYAGRESVAQGLLFVTPLVRTGWTARGGSADGRRRDYRSRRSVVTWRPGGPLRRAGLSCCPLHPPFRGRGRLSDGPRLGVMATDGAPSTTSAAVGNEVELAAAGRTTQGVPPSDTYLKESGHWIADFAEYADMYRRSVREPERFWTELAAREFVWHPSAAPTVGDALQANFDVRHGRIEVQWFRNARTNICYNAVDRHVHAGRGDQVAFHYEANDVDDARAHRAITYAQGDLHADGARAARGHAGVCAHRRGAQRGVWRLFGGVVGGPHCRRAVPRGDHLRRRDARLQAGAPETGGRRGHRVVRESAAGISGAYAAGAASGAGAPAPCDDDAGAGSRSAPGDGGSGLVGSGGACHRHHQRRRSGGHGRAAAGGGRRVGPCRGAAVYSVHLGEHRQAQRRAAYRRRVHGRRCQHLQVRFQRSSGRRVLLHRRLRLDHRPLVWRVRADAERRHAGAIRGRAHVAGRRPPLGHRGQVPGDASVHGADGHSGAEKGRRRVREAVLAALAQVACHGGRAYQPSGVGVVSPGGRRRSLQCGGHLLADRNRCAHDCVAAGARLSTEAGLGGRALLRRAVGGAGCQRPGDSLPAGRGIRGAAVHSGAVAVVHPVDLRRSRAHGERLLQTVPGLLPDRRWVSARWRGLLLADRSRGRCHQRERAPHGHRRGGERAVAASGRGRSRRCGHAARDQGRGHLLLRDPQRRLRW